jgi:hypothetical protein
MSVAPCGAWKRGTGKGVLIVNPLFATKSRPNHKRPRLRRRFAHRIEEIALVVQTQVYGHAYGQHNAQPREQSAHEYGHNRCHQLQSTELQFFLEKIKKISYLKTGNMTFSSTTFSNRCTG